MIKKLLRTILYFCSILTIALGVMILTVRIRLLDHNTFRLALAPSGLYQQLRFAIEDSLIAKTAGESAVNSVIAEEVLVEIDLRSQVIEASEKNLVNFFAWLNKEDKDLDIYFPQKKIIDSLENPELQSSLKLKLPELITKLPDCTSELKLESAELPICRNTPDATFGFSAENMVMQYLANLKPAEEIVDELLKDAPLPPLTEETELSQLESLLEKPVRDSLASTLEMIRNLANTSAMVGITSLATGIILILCIIFTGELKWRGVICTIASILLVSGLITTILNGAVLIFPDQIIARLPEYFLLHSGMSNDVRLAAEDYHRNLINVSFQISLYSGIVISVISAMLLLTGKLMPQTSQEKQSTETIGAGLPVDNDLAPKLVDIPFQ